MNEPPTISPEDRDDANKLTEQMQPVGEARVPNVIELKPAHLRHEIAPERVPERALVEDMQGIGVEEAMGGFAAEAGRAGDIEGEAAENVPSLAESCFVLAVLGIAIAGCWMLYGPVIRAMARAMF